MASRSRKVNTGGAPLLDLRDSSRKSTTRTTGKRLSSTRLAISSRVYLPRRALWKLSIDGVADPSKTTAPSRWPRTTATSRAW